MARRATRQPPPRSALTSAPRSGNRIESWDYSSDLRSLLILQLFFQDGVLPRSSQDPVPPNGAWNPAPDGPPRVLSLGPHFQCQQRFATRQGHRTLPALQNRHSLLTFGWVSGFRKEDVSMSVCQRESEKSSGFSIFTTNPCAKQDCRPGVALPNSRSEPQFLRERKELF